MNQIRDIAADDASTILTASGPVRASRSSLYARHFKRPFDIALSIVLIPLIGPLVAVLWLLVRCDGGSGFYGHPRVGRNGRMFRCWKLRSMVPQAEKCLAEYLVQNPDARAEWELSHKLKFDPRITWLGRILRKTSLDELPQIWNVLRGEMSFVGPRPVTNEELARYGSNAWAYGQATPGVTGLWQVSGRNAVTYQRRVALDVRYVENMSFAQDLRILAKTGAAVLNGTGA
ncbi:sugar transferase [Yoonia sp. R2331]|uniref:sugar transferase n=1 Tax=Yoonia sp. R2331 TaxID=3237238 RepID=UPI0034E5648E